VGFRIYFGPRENPLSNVVEIRDPSATSAVLEITDSPGLYYFTVTAVDRMGRESGFSELVSKRIP